MNYIVLDLEFNQTYDFNDGELYAVDSRCQFEIIQIGAAKLNSNFEIIEEFNILVKPQIYKKIHPIVEKLTTLNTKSFENEQFFPNAYSSFVDFIGDEQSTLCIWGPYDIKALYKNIFFYNLSHGQLSPVFINVQSLASKFLKYPTGMSVGLKNAVETFNLVIDKPFHNALNDAVYTAKILEKLKEEKITTVKFNISQLDGEEEPKKEQINTKLLYDKIEKDLGRKISKNEKRLYRNIYLLGRNKKFDV